MKIINVLNCFLLSYSLFHYAGFTADAVSKYELGLVRQEAEQYLEAQNNYSYAADLGYAPAQNKLGEMYADALGVELDFSKALRFFQLAADQGNADAQFNLGEMYVYGCGVKVNLKQAQHYYKLAAGQEHAKAKENLKDTSTILCVIDMQPSFKSSQNEETIKNVQTAIEKAIQRKQTIIFIEYAAPSIAEKNVNERTDSRLTDLVKGFPNYTLNKLTESGASEIEQKCEDKSLLPYKIKICGVNTSMCVLKTVKELHKIPLFNTTKIKLLANACNDRKHEWHKQSLNEMSRLKRVKIKE